MKTLYLYWSIIGFNVLVVCLTFLVWYYLTDLDVEIGYSPSPSNRTNIVDEKTIAQIPWFADIISKYQGIEKICTLKADIGCDYQIPPMKMYQIDFFVSTMRLMNIAPNEPYSVYSGFFKYHDLDYGMAIHTTTHYLDYILYGISSSVIGTLVIILVWRKTQSKTTFVNET
jgi:hypothetical protein